MSAELANISMAVAVVSMFLTVYIGMLAFTKRDIPLDEKLKKFTAVRTSISNAAMENRSFKHFLTSLSHLAPRKWSEGLDRELVRGGIPLKGGEFFALQGLLTLFFFLLGFLLTRNPLPGLGFGVLGLILPRLWLKSAQKRKRQRFNNQLADALLILANSMRAGFSLLQAMEMVGQEMPNPISGELRLTLREMTYGTPTEDALQRLAERVGSSDLDLLVTAILIQRNVGGNLAEVLMNIHATIQDRIRIQHEIKTLTAQGRMSGYLIAALPFGIAGVLVAINPSYIKLLVTNSLGWKLLGFGLVSQFIGFLIIRKIIAVEV